MASFKKNQSLKDFQAFIGEVYGLPDDRIYSLWDLLTQQQRFTMRALKGIRKGDKRKLSLNLIISISWLAAIANRLHINLDDEVWHRFPNLCSYCGQKPCVCKKQKIKQRVRFKRMFAARPGTLAGYQKMFAGIYPPESRTLPDAGVHLAEEMGEVSEAIHNFLGLHLEKQFKEVKLEIADFISCAFGVANSAGIDLVKELSEAYKTNCHVCHQAPCECRFAKVAALST